MIHQSCDHHMLGMLGVISHKLRQVEVSGSLSDSERTCVDIGTMPITMCKLRFTLKLKKKIDLTLQMLLSLFN